MESIVKSLEYITGLDIFQNSKNLNSYIDRYKNQLSTDESQSLLTLFNEITIYKEHQDLSYITPSHLDEVLNILKKYDTKIDEVIGKIEVLEFINLTFKGKTGEYFKIWIVNVFLTLITFGIYSAWAKVRTNRYFYANTYLHDSSFEYTADPIKILKGRLIIFAFYLLFMASSQIFLNPAISGILLLLFLLIIPWIVTKAIKFKLKNTKYKNVNFHYLGSSLEMYIFFFIHLILNIFTFFLAYPYSLNKFKELIINNSSYGNSYFSYDGKTKDMYINFLKIVGIYILVIFALGILVATAQKFLIPHLTINLPKPSTDVGMMIGLFIVEIVVFIIYIFLAFGSKALYDAIIQNYTWNHTQLKIYPFNSRLSSLKLVYIYTTNILAILFSFGLLYPWTKIRTLRYKLENLYIAIDDNFITKASSITDESSIGEEADDFFDLDIGI
jgi:uncharacterized membrane protein YjgN (DUF898 family)